MSYSYVLYWCIPPLVRHAREIVAVGGFAIHSIIYSSISVQCFSVLLVVKPLCDTPISGRHIPTSTTLDPTLVIVVYSCICSLCILNYSSIHLDPAHSIVPSRMFSLRCVFSFPVCSACRGQMLPFFPLSLWFSFSSHVVQSHRLCTFTSHFYA